MYALILPGLHDSDPEHWQSQWEARAETMHRVIQDDWVTPRCADWVSKLDEALPSEGQMPYSSRTAPVARWLRIGPPAGRHVVFAERCSSRPAILRRQAFPLVRPALRQCHYSVSHFEVL
jgi:hypothetical protein